MSRHRMAVGYNILNRGKTVVIPLEQDAARMTLPAMPASLPGSSRISNGEVWTGHGLRPWLRDDIMLPDDVRRAKGTIVYTEQPISRPYPRSSPDINNPRLKR